VRARRQLRPRRADSLLGHRRRLADAIGDVEADHSVTDLERIEQDLFFLGRLSKLRQRPSFDLANPLLSHAQRRPDFFQSLGLLSMVQAEPAGDDFLLTLV